MPLVEHLSDAADQIATGRVNIAAILHSQKLGLGCFDLDESEIVGEAILDEEVSDFLPSAEKATPADRNLIANHDNWQREGQAQNKWTIEKERLPLGFRKALANT